MQANEDAWWSGGTVPLVHLYRLTPRPVATPPPPPSTLYHIHEQTQCLYIADTALADKLATVWSKFPRIFRSCLSGPRYDPSYILLHITYVCSTLTSRINLATAVPGSWEPGWGIIKCKKLVQKQNWNEIYVAYFFLRKKEKCTLLMSPCTVQILTINQRRPSQFSTREVAHTATDHETLVNEYIYDESSGYSFK
jgi:hypothetical protein